MCLAETSLTLKRIKDILWQGSIKVVRYSEFSLTKSKRAYRRRNHMRRCDLRYGFTPPGNHQLFPCFYPSEIGRKIPLDVLDSYLSHKTPPFTIGATYPLPAPSLTSSGAVLTMCFLSPSSLGEMPIARPISWGKCRMGISIRRWACEAALG